MTRRRDLRRELVQQLLSRHPDWPKSLAQREAAHILRVLGHEGGAKGGMVVSGHLTSFKEGKLALRSASSVPQRRNGPPWGRDQ